MAEDNNMVYNTKHAIPNKLLQEDGTITTLSGEEVTTANTEYKNKVALPNKFLNPDGSYSTLSEILAGAVSGDLFVIVDELPETGENNKIYMLVDDDKLIEYVWVNDEWNPLGMVEFDISQYSTTEQMNTAITAALNLAKSYADGVASTAENNAKSYADGVASTAENNAKSYADGVASTAENNAKSYTDSAIQQSITQVLGGSY